MADNFSFLQTKFPILAKFGSLAEQYLYSDSNDRVRHEHGRSHYHRSGTRVMDMVVRIQFKGESSKEFSLCRYEMEFIYP